MQGWNNQTKPKKKFLEHKKRAKLEKDYYNQNVELVREQKNNTVAHYSFDWAQNVSVPHFSQQPSWVYFSSLPKVHLFGIQNEANGEQINYVLDESELLNKGINGTLSLVFNGIKQFDKGEKHLKLTCDNAVGQNKNNTTLWFLLYLVIAGYYGTVELDTMIAGHTKFSPDRSFGMIKKLYRRSTIFSKESFVKVVEESSPAGLNKVQCYEEGKGFQYLDFKVLEKYFNKLPRIGKHHHFFFESSNLGVVKVKEFVDSEWEEFDLLKDNGREREEVIEEIRNLVFTILPPKSLSLERQIYLYEKIRPLLPENYQNVVCPEPTINSKDLLQ
ncbi:MAG: hypothetical protein I3273_02745 [Candidatus Moeniiplasma glomeromycotorum]|nr:hypothetical protein [Candidatus Moeniiplasma glomeromycotorum]MCE8167626.1 hypothetical protein [Candidatus Moeniiplasma glomeromycotorum]MCE8169023.1 hypothetical protein [Candidatus Moeniiplasma glomeromycotorum]